MLTIEDNGLFDFKIVNSDISPKREYIFKASRWVDVLFYYIFCCRTREVSLSEIQCIRYLHISFKEDKKRSDEPWEVIQETFSEKLLSLSKKPELVKTMPAEVGTYEQLTKNASDRRKKMAQDLGLNGEQARILLRFTADNSRTHKKYFDNDVRNADGIITGSAFNIISSATDKRKIPLRTGKGSVIALKEETLNIDYYSQRYHLLNNIVDYNLYPKITDDKHEYECLSFLTKGIHDNKIILLSGKYGSGKTTILGQLLRQQPQGISTIYIDANDLVVEKGHICDLMCRRHVSGNWNRNSFTSIITALEEFGHVVSILVDHSEKLESKYLENLLHELTQLYINLPYQISIIITGTIFDDDLVEYLKRESVVKDCFLVASMCPLPASAIKNQNIHLIEPTPFEAWIANTSRPDGPILNRFELYHTYYEKLLRDNLGPYGRKICKYFAWYERVNDGLPKEINSLEQHSRENFPGYFTTTRLSQDYYFDLSQCGLITAKSNGYYFMNVDARDYLASQFIADIIVKNEDLDTNEFIDESRDLIKSVTLLMSSNSVKNVITSNAHAFGEYVFRSLVSNTLNVTNDLSLLKLGLTVGYYSKYSVIDDIKPLIDEYLESTKVYAAADIEIVSEINDYLYEILTRTYSNDAYKLKITEYILATLQKCASILSEIACDKGFEAEFDKSEMSNNGSLFQIVSAVEGKDHYDNLNHPLYQGIIHSLSDINPTSFEIIQSMFSFIDERKSTSTPRILAGVLAVIYGNIGACYLELGVKCKGRKKTSDIRQAEFFHMLGLYGRTHSTGNVIRSLICLGTDCYHLSKNKTAKQVSYLTKAVHYYSDAENLVIDEARKAISNNFDDNEVCNNLLFCANWNDDYVTICRNKLGCLFELFKLIPDGKAYSKDKRTYRKGIYDLTIKTIESIEAYCEHPANSVTFIEKTVIDFADSLQTNYLPFIKDVHNKDRLRGNKPYIDMKLIEVKINNFCTIYNQLETVSPITPADLF